MTNDDFQFQVIDALANNSTLLRKYEKTLKSFKVLHQELESLIIEKNEAIKELDYNTFLFNELSKANLVEGELEGLESEYETLNNVEQIKDHTITSR